MTAPRHKWSRVLAALAQGRRLHRFQAARDLHDSCLHSTVAYLQGLGLRVDRELIQIPGYDGSTVRVAEYWLADDQRERARKLLGS